jgi:hypothetical protein
MIEDLKFNIIESDGETPFWKKSYLKISLLYAL